MKLLPWILLLLALAASAALGHVVFTSASRGPSDYLASAQGRLAAVPPDLVGAASELQFGIDLAERENDQATLAALLETRGLMLRGRRAFDGAEADFRRLLEVPDYPRDRALLELAEIAAQRQDHDAAIELIDQLLAVTPEGGRAYAIRGSAYRALGGAVQEELAARVTAVLPAGDAAAATELLDRIVHLPTATPLRAALQYNFEALFPESLKAEREASRPKIDEAGRLLTLARSDFTAALGLQTRPDSAYPLLDMLRRSGRLDETVDLGLALWVHDWVATDMRAMQVLSGALVAVGRPRAADQVNRQVLGDGPLRVERRFLPEWARILYATESWERLVGVANELGVQFAGGINDQAQRDAAEYFRGVALARGSTPERALESLTRFVAQAPTEPVPDAVPMAWRLLADLHREADNQPAYRQALEQAVRTGPDLSGNSWLELADLREAANERAVEVLQDLTHALRLLPERLAELEPRWNELGERSLREADRDLELVRVSLARRGQYTDPDIDNPYEHLRLSHLHRDRGNLAGAIAACQRVLRDYPRFLPAFDLLVDIHLSRGDQESAVPLMLERLVFDPADTRGLATLRSLDDAGELAPAHRLQLMQRDPRYAGTLGLARRLLRDGELELAALALEQAGVAEVSTAARLLAAEAQVGLGRSDRALAVLEGVPGDDPQLAEVVQLRVQAAFGARSIDRLPEWIAPLDEATTLQLEPALEAVDQLLLARQPQLALRILAALDRLPETRSGEVVARTAVAQLLARDFGAARDALERMVAFREDGVAEFGELWMAVREERWSDVPGRARAVRATRFDPSPYQSCLLAALEEREQEAYAIAQQGESTSENGPPWGLARAAIEALIGEPIRPSPRYGQAALEPTQRMVRGVRQRPRDPRSTLALLLAIEFPDWRLLASADLRTFGEEAGDLWPRYLRAEADRRLERETEATLLLRALTREYPQFSPGWGLLEELEAERLERLEHPELLALRAGRALALGAPPATDADALLAQVSVLESTGRHAQAQELAQRVVDRDPANLRARLLLGRVQALRDEVGPAVLTFGRFFASAPVEVSVDYLELFLQLLDAARERGAISEVVHTNELQALAARHPRDPLVAAARAAGEIRASGSSLAVGLARAWRLLDDFRQATGHEALEELHRGSTDAWYRLILPYDPDRAETLVAGELERTPDLLDLWLMLGHVYEVQDRREDAIEHYQTIRTMVPDPRALRMVASLLADLGSDHRRVEQTIDRVRAMEGDKGQDPSLRFILARSMVNSGGQLLDNGLEELGRLWQARAQHTAKLPLGDLARTYGTALVHRARVEDRALANEVLLVAIEHTPDDLVAREVLQVLAPMALRMTPATRAVKP
jgi:tetratricopeptide (TPR) repeat protein